MTSVFMFLISSSLLKLRAAKPEIGLKVVRRCPIMDGDGAAGVASLMTGACAGLLALK
jgi:hypothetical protein